MTCLKIEMLHTNIPGCYFVTSFLMQSDACIKCNAGSFTDK